jgi:putative membrane protein
MQPTDNKPALNKDLILREKLAIQRTVMTNYTTLLSFIRTALYFSVAGLSINNLMEISYGLWIEVGCWIFAALILIAGFINYFVQKRRIEESKTHIGNYKLEYEKGLVAEEDL